MGGGSAACVTLRLTPTDHPDLLALVGELDAFFRLEWGQAAERYQPHHNLKSMACAVVAYVDGKPAGCGCWKPLDSRTAEIKRMYVRPAFRRKGVAARVLVTLEENAKARGRTSAVLETGAEMVGALCFYRAMGYRLVPNYGDFVGDSLCVCMKKEFPAEE